MAANNSKRNNETQCCGNCVSYKDTCCYLGNTDVYVKPNHGTECLYHELKKKEVKNNDQGR